ncbi:MAG TPA: DUF5723 family protein [Cytophagaceae bacterium]|nr:DUF5723 family protein [Cytophagaceae bacterium]
MENVFQSTYSNPAAIPDHYISVGLPGISSAYMGVTNTGFTYNQLVRGDSFDINNALKKSQKKNFVYAGVNVDIFHLRIKARTSFISFHISEKTDARFSYPKDLLSLAWQGNYQFKGNKADLASLGVDFNYYREFGVGYVREGKKWNIGGTAKFLQGFVNAHVKNKNLNLKVADQTYDLTAISNGSLNTSGMSSDFSDPKTYLMNNLTNFSNRGMAFDLGATYKHNDKWNFSFSVNNIGFIHWAKDVKNYNIQGGTTFDGIHYKVPNSNDTSHVNYTDSLKNSFKYTETAHKYTTWVIPQFYARVKYNLTKKTMLNGSLSLERYKAFRTSATIGVTQKIGNIFSLLLTYTYQYRNLDNAGIGIVINPGPVQLYFVSDCILRTYSYSSHPFIIIPKDAKSINFRVGINLVFGRIRLPEKQTAPKK